MPIHLTPALMERHYEMLCLTKPFTRWKMPSSDDVEFHATTIKDACQGEYYFRTDARRHVIRINPKRHHTLHSQIMTMAHEMVHLRERMLSTKAKGHGFLFQRLSDQVCRHHGFDRGQF